MTSIEFIEQQEDSLAKITINNNGSIRVEGEFTICDASGSVF